MISDGSPFFTLDRGTVGTAVALIGPLEGRSRLLAASSAPIGIDVDALLEDLAWRVARTDPASIAAPDGWRAWPRLEVRTLRPRRAVVVAASDRVGVGLEDAFGRSGWDIVARHIGPRPDILALGEACLDPDADAVVVGIADAADDEERGQMRSIWPLVVSIASMREDLAVIACGTFAERPEAIGEERLFALPAPEPGTTSVLRDAAREIGEHLASAGAPVPDGHQAFRTSVASLAVLLNCRVEGIELGASSSSRTLAGPDREARHRASAGGALLGSAGGERDLDAILRWSSVQGDPAVLADRLRDLAARPWQLLDDDGARLRLAALRAALWRLREAADSAPEGRAEDDTSDVIVLAGGSLGGLPPLALALAVTDLIRRPGATTILGDHARVLAPLGALASERDRRRILADLMDDCLLPIGSTLLTGDTSSAGARAPATIAISSALGTDQLSLEPEQLQTVDLPPGIVARLDIDPGEGSILGVSGRRLALEVSGGLGGLLIDTRPLQLSLPDGGEARRAVLETWERPAWDRRAGIEAAA